jgi:CRP-like cAMP-binding protein
MGQAAPFVAPALPSAGHNDLLAALSAAETARLAPHLELVELPLGEVLYQPGVPMQHAYFPITCIASLHYVTESGESAESAGVGHEGMIGIALFLGGSMTPSSAVLQTAGRAYRIKRSSLQEEFNRGGLLQRVLLRYTLGLMAQIAQTAACNRHHSVEQRLCRCLLMTLDRVPSGQLVLTQELIAGMLGVRREGITEAAGRLQLAGVIRYRRGHITVQQRSGLESGACECYRVVAKELARLISGEQARERSGTLAH